MDRQTSLFFKFSYLFQRSLQTFNLTFYQTISSFNQVRKLSIHQINLDDVFKILACQEEVFCMIQLGSQIVFLIDCDLEEQAF